ncbi:MAG: sugar ABC transporter substrate-binding protein [Rhodospirillales bacterium]|nr:sugar ABC transporter substrate-binding protein [Rhodospirillales bacterium]
MRGLKLAAVAAVLGMMAPALARADGETVALFTKNQTNPFFAAERIGAEKAAAMLHVRLLEYVPTKADSIAEQMSQIDDVVVKKPAAVVLVPVDYKAIGPGVARINAAGIPVVNVTDRSASGNFVAFVGANDHDIGKAIAEVMLKALGGKGNVILLEGVPGSLTSQDRTRGFRDALKEYPDVKVVASQPANFQRLQGMQVMENLLQSHPDVNGVIAANDAMAIGAIDALNDAGRKALVVGINATKEAVDAIKAGRMLASGDYNGFLQGCIGTMIAVRAVRHEPIRSEITLPVVVVSKANAQAYDTPVDQRTCPSWSEVAGQ